MHARSLSDTCRITREPFSGRPLLKVDIADGGELFRDRSRSPSLSSKMNSTDFLYGLIVVLYVTLILIVGGLFLSRSKRKKAREEAVAAAEAAAAKAKTKKSRCGREEPLKEEDEDAGDDDGELLEGEEEEGEKEVAEKHKKESKKVK